VYLGAKKNRKNLQIFKKRLCPKEDLASKADISTRERFGDEGCKCVKILKAIWLLDPEVTGKEQKKETSPGKGGFKKSSGTAMTVGSGKTKKEKKVMAERRSRRKRGGVDCKRALGQRKAV